MEMGRTFEADITHFDPRNPYQGDEKIPVQFYVGAVLNDAATAKEGRPIYNDVECIKIFNSKDNVIDRPLRDTDKQRWPRAYSAWKQGGESDPGASGTRLEHWPQMTRSQVEEYKFFKVFTVEQLAALADSTVQKIMGAPKLKQMAQLYVEAAKGEAPFLRMQAELDKRDGTIAELSAEVKRLTEMVEKLAKAA
jgi:hypothetical protein